MKHFRAAATETKKGKKQLVLDTKKNGFVSLRSSLSLSAKKWPMRCSSSRWRSCSSFARRLLSSGGDNDEG